MMFCAKNELGEPTWKLVIEGRKTVTRRFLARAIEQGKEFAVTAGRGQPTLCRAKVITCMKAQTWLELNPSEREKLEEGMREGFRTWEGLQECLAKMPPKPGLDLYRIEFTLLPKEPKQKTLVI